MQIQESPCQLVPCTTGAILSTALAASLQYGRLANQAITAIIARSEGYGMRETRAGTTRRAGRVSFRNRRGEDLDVPSFKATEAKNAFGRMLETALRKGAIVITKHEDPKAVLLSWEEFEALTSARSAQLATLTSEFDAALERMQTARARKGMRDAFAATPAQLGKAAVAVARRRG